jgi:hypothetical protein
MSAQFDEDFEKALDVLRECYYSSESMASSVMNRKRWGRPSLRLRILKSDDDPPIISERKGEWIELYPPDYERLLGQYSGKNTEIILFTKGIEWLANKMNLHPSHLEKIVKLHEYAHALHHLGSGDLIIEKGVELARIWKAKHRCFQAAPSDFKEQIAQVTTLLAIRHRRGEVQLQESKDFFSGLEDIFIQLMRNQSEPYRLPDVVLEMDENRLQIKLTLLLRMSDNGTYPALSDMSDIMM